MPFLPNTKVYVLAAINCLAEEFGALRDKVQAKVDKGTASPDLPQQLQDTAAAYTAGVTVLRSMVAQVASVDLEFADPLHCLLDAHHTATFHLSYVLICSTYVQFCSGSVLMLIIDVFQIWQ